MKLLLDTHIWIWLTENPRRVGQSTYRTLQNLQHEIWISPISIVEAFTLHHKGKVILHGDPMEWVARASAAPKKLHSQVKSSYPQGNSRLIGIPPIEF